MANISTENINTLAQLAASISDGDYIYIYKAASNSFARIERSVFAQTIADSAVASDVVKSNVNSIVDKLNELISNLANYALLDEVSQMADLDWEDGGDEPSVDTPVLTSPSGSINVGTLAYNESTIIKTVTVKGNYLTQPLSISVSGDGFSVSTQTVSAANANNGTTISITYTNSGAGDGNTKYGTLTISSSEITTKRITLSAKKNQQSVQPGNAVTVDTTGLNGVTSSHTGGATTGNSFYTKLGTSNNLYVVDDSSVHVTMDGTDITSQVYADDEINIPVVTGDIVISASAMTYVAGDLVLHLDGKNRGGVPGKWTSLVSYDDENGFNAPIEFTLSNETTLDNYDSSKGFSEEEDHVSFKGFSKGLANIDSLPVASFDGTIEVAYNNADLASNSNVLCVLQNTTYTGDRGAFIAFGSFYLNSVGDTTKNYITNSCTGPSSGEYFAGRYKSARMLKSEIEAGGFFSLSALSGGASVGTTNFYRNNIKFTEGDVAETTGAVMGTGANSTLSLMYRVNASNVQRYSIADLYSVRVYKRRLTDAERTQNYQVDLKRFKSIS